MDYLVFGLGGNEGDVKSAIEKCYLLLVEKVGPIISKSSFYKTKAWGKTNQPDFINSVVIIESNLTPSKVLSSISIIEKSFGRERSKQEKWGKRPIDIDLLFFGKRIIKSKNLIVPHPYLHQRNFVLKPLCEIAPDFLHPTFNLPASELMKINLDSLKVEKLNVQ